MSDGDDGILDCDVLLVGAGIMSATVGVLLKELDPDLTLEVIERLDRVAGESSEARNNAGTGHAALCELNYTPAGPDGRVNTTKAVKVSEQFEVSKQFWAWLVGRAKITHPGTFIRSVPHVSFVTGADDVDFLERRHAALQSCALFGGMEFSRDRDELARWIPLMMSARDGSEPVAATRSRLGTDVNFGALTRRLFGHLEKSFGVRPWFRHELRALERADDARWVAKIFDESLGIERVMRAKFVFLGAGGGALDMLHDSGIPEASGYGGFPVSGLWLVCRNPDVAALHDAKVYGKAKVGTPPMSVPHLDLRYIDGSRALLFGPFAGFSTKFLKEGSYFDLARSFTFDNVFPMLSAGIRNVALTRYLVSQVTQSFDDRIDALREFVPQARAVDWELAVAGQRVQVIKKHEEEGGRLEFGTEIVSAKDNSLAALLGASPGASTSVSIALDLLLDCFPERVASPGWQAKLREIIPSYGHSLAESESLARDVRARSHAALKLTPAE